MAEITDSVGGRKVFVCLFIFICSCGMLFAKVIQPDNWEKVTLTILVGFVFGNSVEHAPAILEKLKPKEKGGQQP